ncbi:hypothetical protein [Phenylobacterium sp.]|uniref:hypothetical protein n=1 Tax=Phenylobacterium sp. TaxID=1871053 RepID=UPI00286D15DD|nr:hypothetical protein [Phenylobacterium sp.]
MKNFVAQVAGIASLALAAVPALALTTAVHAQTHTVRATIQVADRNLAAEGEIARTDKFAQQPGFAGRV